MAFMLLDVESGKTYPGTVPSLITIQLLVCRVSDAPLKLNNQQKNGILENSKTCEADLGAKLEEGLNNVNSLK